jgi:hypothetical protein
MEVLVNRINRRLSRILIVVLVAIVGIGGFFIARRFNWSGGENRAASVAAPAAAQANDPSAKVDPVIDAAAQASPSTRPQSEAWTNLISPTTVPSSSLATLASNTESPDQPVAKGELLADAQSQIDAGDLLQARRQLNDALQAGNLDESQTSKAKAMITQISQTVVFGRQNFADDPYSSAYVVHHGDSLAKIANAHDLTWEFLSRINGIDPKHLRAGATIKVVQGPFFAVVRKSAFMMDIYLGGLPGEKSAMYVTSFSVGLGRDDSTPAGMWIVEPHHKLRHPTYYSPRGEGVIPADDPKNPLGGYWIGLSGTEGQAVGKLSYGIHGTIEPDSIGKQSSMGCIRLKADDIAMVYDLMVEGKSMIQVRE